MTICLAAKFDDGVVVASDSLVSVGSTQLSLKTIKGEDCGNMFVLYAGTLSVIQKNLVELDANDATPWDLQQLLWRQEGKRAKEPAEYLCVFDGEIFLLSNHGEVMTGYDYACVGSEFGWVGLDIIMPDLRNPTYTNVKNKLVKVMRAVSHRDTGVDGPYFAEGV